MNNRVSRIDPARLSPKGANDNEDKYGMTDHILYLGDALTVLKSIPDTSIDLCVTDPPYFIKGLGKDWTSKSASRDKAKRKMINNLPGGMAFEQNQGRDLQAFMQPIAAEMFRVLKPGAFFVSFSQARLFARMSVAIEDAGFEMRDMLAWHYESGLPKAMAQDRFVRLLDIPANDQEALIDDIGGRKTPMLKPMLEPMTLAQKPREGTYAENWRKHRVGLADVSQSIDGMFPGNCMSVPKPTKAQKGEANDHPTVKPVPLIEHLVKLFSAPGQTVLDPFLGSGSHGVAALKAGRKFVGIERDPAYFEIAKGRIDDAA
jgi:site-specific DNA-methyltransferase (adenine-specific)